MQSVTLLAVYVLTVISLQFIGFLVSRAVDYQYPAFSVLAFLVLFIAAFGIAWPIAVRIAERLIRWRGYVVETEQTGGDARRDLG
jgi:hypothetical protein